jgi:ubiquinone/menaquinone biosynthesis C-methylase UbiE
MENTVVAGQYFLAVEGLAILRRLMTAPPTARTRVDEMRRILDHFDDPPQSLEIPVTEYDVEEGYTRWARYYDRGGNPALAAEEQVVHPLLTGIPPGAALDAACGTGRHARKLVQLGHHVIGVDSNEAMLGMARSEQPAIDFRRGRLEDLPVDDESVDLVTCGLALTHVPVLEPVMCELARVLRPGGQIVLSNMHPVMTMTGTVASFPDGDITRGIPFIKELTHQVSDYIAAFSAAGLTICACIEPGLDEAQLRHLPVHAVLPEATRLAFLDLPFLLIWHLKRR